MGWLEVAREVVEQHQFAVVDHETGQRITNPVLDADGMPVEDGRSVLLDAYSAQVMVQVHDHLSTFNAARLAAMPPAMAQQAAFTLLEKVRNR